MSSQISICNRALQMLGAGTITSLSENSKTARALGVAYEPKRKGLLRKYNWNFAIRRAELAADTEAPLFGMRNRFQLPSDFRRLLHDDTTRLERDWRVEAGFIHTNDGSPLKIRYIADVTEPGAFDPLFSELLSAEIAEAICEELTQSTTKLQAVKEIKREAMSDARRMNAFENKSLEPQLDDWISMRV